MRIAARVYVGEGVDGPSPWDDGWGTSLPLDHIICHDLKGAAHTISEFIWPWTAYTPNKKKFLLHFFYWKSRGGSVIACVDEVSVRREKYIRELQFLLTRQIYFGEENSSVTLNAKLLTLRHIARFAEARSCSVRDVFTNAAILDACGKSLPNHIIGDWRTWLIFLRKLDPQTQLGFTIVEPDWDELTQRKKDYRAQDRQRAPLPTRIYATLINNLSAELDDVEVHKTRLLAALREAIAEYPNEKAAETDHGIRMGAALIKKHDVQEYLERRGFSINRLNSLAAAVTEIFLICKLQIHTFSGMRDMEVRTLPYHCMESERAANGRRHCLIVGNTNKFNKGRRMRTKWVTTANDGFRAIRIAQEFATVIYEAFSVIPSEADCVRDNYPLFPSTEYLPWIGARAPEAGRISASGTRFFHTTASALQRRLCPLIEETDIAELEEIDPFRAWSEEKKFTVGQPWHLTSHQLRRSLAIYANASGLVRLSSLRRQLQHITREMAAYYGRGSVFCKNFIENDFGEYKKHIAVDWQDGAEEAEGLAFVRDVLNSTEPMFGGAGIYYERQRERGEVMSRDDVTKQIRTGLLSYQESPLGGCTRTGPCEKRKGLSLINVACATEGCKNLIGKHSKIVRTIQLKRASMIHIAPGSVTEAMELEELEALEGIEIEWRSGENPTPPIAEGPHA